MKWSSFHTFWQQTDTHTHTRWMQRRRRDTSIDSKKGNPNPLPKRREKNVTIKCIDFPSQISIFLFPFIFFFFLFLQSLRLQSVLHHLVVTATSCSLLYLLRLSSEWFMCLPIFTRVQLFANEFAKKAHDHRTTGKLSVCVRLLSVYTFSFAHTKRQCNQSDWMFQFYSGDRQWHMLMMNEFLMWMNDVCCNWDGIVNKLNTVTHY